jgi:hypothetical protein
MDRDSGKSNPSRQRQEEDNPFIAFRRYADELMSDLVHTVMGSSSSSSYENSLRQQREAWNAASKQDKNAECQQRESRWYNAESRWPKSTQHSEKTGDGFADEESDSRSYDIPVKKWKGVHDDSSMDEEERTCPYRRYRVPAPVFRHPDDPELFWSGHSVRFWAFSPYSPYRLMQQEQTRNSGPDWIEAFQDLLRHEEASKNCLPAEEASKSQLDPWGGLDEDEWNIPELPAILRRLTTAAHKMTTSPSRELASKQPENDNEEDFEAYSEENFHEVDRSGILELSKLLGSMNMGTRIFKELDLRELEDAPEEESVRCWLSIVEEASHAAEQQYPISTKGPTRDHLDAYYNGTCNSTGWHSSHQDDAEEALC